MKCTSTCADGDPQFWTEVGQAGDPKNSEAFMEWMRDENLAPKPSDPELSPPAKRKADASERVRDAELAAVLSKT